MSLSFLRREGKEERDILSPDGTLRRRRQRISFPPIS
jgi:hypothetical protein